MLRSGAMRLQSDLPQSDMENLLRQRFPLRQRHRAGQGTTVSPPGSVERGSTPTVSAKTALPGGLGNHRIGTISKRNKKGMTAGEACHALLIKLLRSGRLP